MAPDHVGSSHLAQLRQRAEEVVRTRSAGTNNVTGDAIPRLLHELQTHQIELELQNEDLRRAQVELATARDRYADLYTFAPISYITVGHNGLIVETNLMATELLGAERQRLIGERLSRFVIADDVGLFFAHQKRVGRHEGPQRCELRMARASGEVFHAQLESAPGAPDGGSGGYQVTITDISKLKQAEAELSKANDSLELKVDERTAELRRINEYLEAEIADREKAEQELHTVLQSMSHFIWAGEVDETGVFRYTYFSPVVAEITGRTPEYFLSSARSNLRIVHAEDRPRVFHSIRSVFERRPESQGIEYRVVRPDGTTRWVHDTVVARPLPNGRLSLSGVVSDITQRKDAEDGKLRVERELAVHREASVRSDRLRSLGEMAAGMAHELNQPLAGVRGSAEHIILAMERDWELTPATLRTRLTRVIDQVDRMTHIIDHVRLFARESGKPSCSSIDANAVANAGISMLANQFRSQGIGLVSRLSAGLPTVWANAYSLEEVILNLLTNARDSLEQELDTGLTRPEASVSIRTRLIDRDGQHIQIEVADNGPGIPPNILESVFDPFFTTKDPDKGTGLGLSICKTIVESFGGTIEIESTVSVGTTAVITLPVENEAG